MVEEKKKGTVCNATCNRLFTVKEVVIKREVGVNYLKEVTAVTKLNFLGF